MNYSIQQRIVSLRNQLQTYKVAAPLNYGQLTSTSRPQKTLTTSVNQYEMVGDSAIARFVARFTRDDGIKLTPYVDFAVDYDINPNLQSQNSQLGYTLEGRYPEAWYGLCFSTYITDIGGDWVEATIDINNYFYLLSGNSAEVTLSVEAISTVSGTLTLERVYG